ncbi:putative lipid II flippase FtsW [uncultured Oscillibacter sp.]|uniref:putative lipid II flippase FtsW n=1 Tax=uncultured Oscillibacter sp. TaxID=876091 RepID=UPI0028038F5B|nr:putative lipid II flippase FtsW [uncultured Oscillibacter sp.]
MDTKGFIRGLRNMDAVFLLMVLLLLGIGLVMLLSASFPSAYYEMGDPTYYFKRQVCFAAMGLVAMLRIGCWDYAWLRRIAKPAMAGALLLLVLVLVPGIGVVRNNARRWISVAGLFTIQPSELVKLAIIVQFSASIAKKKEQMQTWRDGVRPYLCLLILAAGLVLVEPHLSGAVLVFGVGAILMAVGGIRLRWIVGAGVLAALGVCLLLSGVIPYGRSRIDMWKDPFADAQGAGYQLSQSLITIGSGGLTGVGLGRSRQKFLFLPEEHNDFIFAIVCEELGLIGAGLILLLFMALILRGYWIALHARDRFGTLLAVGITSLLALQTFLNVGVVTGLLPTTGISLPFFSYGGTALFLQLIEMGIILSVSAQKKEKNLARI